MFQKFPRPTASNLRFWNFSLCYAAMCTLWSCWLLFSAFGSAWLIIASLYVIHSDVMSNACPLWPFLFLFLIYTDIAVMENFWTEISRIQRDAVVWMHESFIMMLPSVENQAFIQCLYKLLMMAHGEHYSKVDNWPAEAVSQCNSPSAAPASLHPSYKWFHKPLRYKTANHNNLGCHFVMDLSCNNLIPNWW